MKYQVQENYLTIFLPGELDHHNAEEIRKESDHLIEHNHIRYVIFDFADTKFCDSSGIGVTLFLGTFPDIKNEKNGSGPIISTSFQL